MQMLYFTMRGLAGGSLKFAVLGFSAQIKDTREVSSRNYFRFQKPKNVAPERWLAIYDLEAVNTIRAQALHAAFENSRLKRWCDEQISQHMFSTHKVWCLIALRTRPNCNLIYEDIHARRISWHLMSCTAAECVQEKETHKGFCFFASNTVPFTVQPVHTLHKQ
jgi:hypothetical protein